VGLNCFEPGQSQAVHAHAGADKFYVVLSGKANFVVGERTVAAVAGDLILARRESRTVSLAPRLVRWCSLPSLRRP